MGSVGPGPYKVYNYIICLQVGAIQPWLTLIEVAITGGTRRILDDLGKVVLMGSSCFQGGFCSDSIIVLCLLISYTGG